MKYELNIPAINGDVVPLCLVADAMAKAAATAYGNTPLHKPIFDYQLPIHVKSLLKAAYAGHLQVCNQVGYQGTAEEIIAEAKSSGNLSEVRRYLIEPDWEKLHRDTPPMVEGVGVWDFSKLNLGPTEIDWDTTNILCLYSKLHHLNEWGKTRGDEFSIADECSGWIDERGYMNPKSAFPAVTPAAAKVEAVKGITKQQIITVFEGMHFNDKQWSKYTATPPDWLIGCRVMRGNKSTSALWNPVLIAVELYDKNISIEKLDSVFVALKDWVDEWREASSYFRD